MIPLLLALLALLCVIMGSFLLLYRAFQVSFLWGFAVMIPVVGTLAFIFTHWDDAAEPVGLFGLGILLWIAQFLWVVLFVGA